MSPGLEPGQIMNLPTGIAGLLGGLLPGSPTTTNTNQTTNSSSTQNGNFNQFLNTLLNAITNTSNQQNTSGATQGTTTTAANLQPNQQNLLNSLTQKYQQLTNPSLQGYQAGQIQGINNTSDIQKQAVDNIMASRGLAMSPVAGTAAAGVENSRLGQINSLNESIPLLQNQQNLTNLGASSSFLSSLPGLVGTTSSQTGSNVGQVSQAGQTTNQQTSGQTSGGTTYQTGGNTSNTQGTSTQQQGGSTSSGLAGLLAGLFSDERLKDNIEEITAEKAASKIMSIRPVTWRWKGSEVKDTGVIAQELKKVMPELVNKGEKGLNKVNYAGLIVNLISAVQHINKRMDGVTANV